MRFASLLLSSCNAHSANTPPVPQVRTPSHGRPRTSHSVAIRLTWSLPLSPTGGTTRSVIFTVPQDISPTWRCIAYRPFQEHLTTPYVRHFPFPRQPQYRHEPETRRTGPCAQAPRQRRPSLPHAQLRQQRHAALRQPPTPRRSLPTLTRHHRVLRIPREPHRPRLARQYPHAVDDAAPQVHIGRYGHTAEIGRVVVAAGDRGLEALESHGNWSRGDTLGRCLRLTGSVRWHRMKEAVGDVTVQEWVWISYGTLGPR